MKRSPSLRSMIAAAAIAMLLGFTASTQADDEGWYDIYSDASQLSSDAWNNSVDAYVNGNAYEAYEWNSLSIDANRVADEAWDNWNSSDSSDYDSYGYSSGE